MVHAKTVTVARACASQFLPAWAWFLRFSNLCANQPVSRVHRDNLIYTLSRHGHTTQNPINAQPPLLKNWPAGVDA